MFQDSRFRRIILAFLAIPLASLSPTGPSFTGRGGLAASEEKPASVDAEKTGEGESSEEEESSEWNVDAPRLPTQEVPLVTDEGTWMSLDLSPDGKEIVFDLLGDIYLLDLTGKATPLTSGIAWDMQPRFSPDGQRIAFTSDRGAGDNIWVMNRDGSEPRQVTRESFRLLNSPVWTPDGQYIAARKHFTSRRSLGAGEIWLYHHTGGQGVQMVARPNDQKDLGEPAFSPDGRYLYYSRDATPGSTFEYNKDSNGEIYSIFRLDRETGETRKWLGGPGGAIRPTPSPDGRQLAFIKRVRFRSVLHVQDLESGRITALYDDLDRDLQEAWAIHGVYPTMAWTPDSESIVFWAGGKIRRIRVESREVLEIPFRVESTREIVPALRHRVEVAPARFLTRMLRWVRVSPDGGKVVFQTLGHLWIRSLPDGEPRRLTRQEDHFELYPEFSRDGKKLVYVSWSDTELGAVRELDLVDGSSRVLTPRPGHYIEPIYSPDGETVIYRQISGGYLRSPLWSLEPGLYRVPVAGGESVRLESSGSSPHFGASSDRLFVMGSDSGQRALISLDLEGRDRRVHFRSSNGTDLRVSPDGRWVALVERFNVHVFPFVRPGQPVNVGPGSRAIPLKKVTRDAGESIHWSGDSSTLHWSLGPTLYSRGLADTFAFLEGAPEELPGPTEEGVQIGFEHPTAVPAGFLALVGGRVLTMRGDEILEDATVLVEGDRIRQVGPRAEVEIPEGARVVDVSGRTVMPGLVDVHAHGAQGTSGIIPQQNWISHSELSFGVTTIHDPSNHTQTIFAASEMQRAGKILSPRIFSTGTILYGAAADFKAEIESLDDARFHLRRMQAVGAFTVKSYNQPRRDQRQQVIQAASELGMMVVPEGGSLFQHNMTMVVDGHTGVEHCLPVAKIYSDVLQLWGSTEVGYTPTLGVGYGGRTGELYWYHHTEVWDNERLLAFVPREVVDPKARRPSMAPEEEYNHIQAARVCKQLLDLGVMVNLGAHGQREGLAAHWEIWMFVQGGMTPHEALRCATINGARYIGLDGDLGTIEPGKLADIIVLERDPLANIRDSEHVLYTVLGGQLLEASTLNRLAPDPRERAPFFFEAAHPAAGGATGPVHAHCGCRG